MNRIAWGTAVLLFASQPALADPSEHNHETKPAEHHHMHEHHEAFAAGEPGDPSKPARQVKILMQETANGMIFTPADLSVAKDEQIAFLLENVGQLEHEFVLNTAEGNEEHKREMEEHAEMAHHEPNAEQLEPGEKKTLVWRFTNPGTFEYACLIPGHYEAGMHGTVTVK